MGTPINRYSQPTIARYNPRSLEEMMIAPAYMRGEHDKLDEAREVQRAKLAQADGLALHDERLRQKQQELYAQMDAHGADLLNNGFSPSSKSDFYKFNADYQQAIGPKGEIGKIAAAKAALEANKETYITNATAAGYSPQQAAINWAKEEAAYKTEFDATGEIKNIGNLYAHNYFSVVDEVDKRALKAGINTTDLGNITSSIKQTEDGSYVLTTGWEDAVTGNEEQLKDLGTWITNQINNPTSDIRKSLDHQGKTPEAAMAEIQGLSNVYKKDGYRRRDSNQISGWSPGAGVGVGFAPGNLNYEAAEAENVTIQTQSYIDRIKAIQEKKIISTTNSVDRINAGVGLLNPNAIPETSETSTLQNRFTEEEQVEYNGLAVRLIDMNSSLQGKALDSPEVLDAVSSYLQGNQNILRQNFVITDDFVTDYGDRSIGISKTDPTKIAAAVKANRSLRRYSIDGEVMSFDDLPNEVKENFNDLNYSGYYSPKNFMTANYGEHQDRKLFVSPIKMTHIDKNGDPIEILVSRSEGEMQNPAFKADMMFNDIFVNSNKYPGLPYKIPGGSDEIIYYPDGISNFMPGAPTNAKYLINTKNENGYGVPVFLSEEQLQNKLYTMFGVQTPGEIKAQNKAAAKAAAKKQ